VRDGTDVREKLARNPGKHLSHSGTLEVIEGDAALAPC